MTQSLVNWPLLVAIGVVTVAVVALGIWGIAAIARRARRERIDAANRGASSSRPR